MENCKNCFFFLKEERFNVNCQFFPPLYTVSLLSYTSTWAQNPFPYLTIQVPLGPSVSCFGNFCNTFCFRSFISSGEKTRKFELQKFPSQLPRFYLTLEIRKRVLSFLGSTSDILSQKSLRNKNKSLLDFFIICVWRMVFENVSRFFPFPG